MCAICASTDYRILYPANFSLSGLNSNIFSARRLPDQIHYQIVKCNKCGLIYSNPILDPQTIKKLYQTSSFTYAKYEPDLITTYWHYLKKYISPYLSPTLLEIGCGNGFFLDFLMSKGIKKVHGIEPGAEVVKIVSPKIRKKIIVNIFKPGQFKPNTFDVICCFQTLDHIISPNEFISECFKILKPDGILLCINHDVSSFFNKLLGEKSPIIDIEHIYLFDQTTLPRLLTKHKFIKIKPFSVANRYPLTYWLRLLPLPKNIKTFLNNTLKLIGLANLRLWLKAGNMGTVAYKIK